MFLYSLVQISASRIRGIIPLLKENRRSKAATLIYTAWNIWKARNRQVFDHLLMTPPQVLLEIKKEIALGKSKRR